MNENHLDDVCFASENGYNADQLLSATKLSGQVFGKLSEEAELLKSGIRDRLKRKSKSLRALPVSSDSRNFLKICSYVRSSIVTELIEELSSLKRVERNYIENSSCLLGSAGNLSNNTAHHFRWLSDLRKRLLGLLGKESFKRLSSTIDRSQKSEDIIRTTFFAGRFSEPLRLALYGRRSVECDAIDLLDPTVRRGLNSGIKEWLRGMYTCPVPFHEALDFPLSKEINTFIVSHRLHLGNRLFCTLLEASSSVLGGSCSACSFEKLSSRDRNRILICNQSELMKPLQLSLIDKLRRIFPVTLTILDFQIFLNSVKSENIPDDFISGIIHDAGADFIMINVPLCAASLQCFDFAFAIHPSDNDLLEVFDRSYISCTTGDLIVTNTSAFDKNFDYRNFDLPPISHLRTYRAPLNLGPFSIEVEHPSRNSVPFEEVKQYVDKIFKNRNEYIEDKKSLLSKIYAKICNRPLGHLECFLKKHKQIEILVDSLSETVIDLVAETIIDLDIESGRIGKLMIPVEVNISSPSDVKIEIVPKEPDLIECPPEFMNRRSNIAEQRTKLMKLAKELVLCPLDESGSLEEALKNTTSRILHSIREDLMHVELMRTAGRIDFVRNFASVIGEFSNADPDIVSDLFSKVSELKEFPEGIEGMTCFWASLGISLKYDQNIPSELAIAQLIESGTLSDFLVYLELFAAINDKLFRVENLLHAVSSEINSQTERFIRMRTLSKK